MRNFDQEDSFNSFDEACGALKEYSPLIFVNRDPTDGSSGQTEAVIKMEFEKCGIQVVTYKSFSEKRILKVESSDSPYKKDQDRDWICLLTNSDNIIIDLYGSFRDHGKAKFWNVITDQVVRREKPKKRKNSCRVPMFCGVAVQRAKKVDRLGQNLGEWESERSKIEFVVQMINYYKEQKEAKTDTKTLNAVEEKKI